jgi:hypothetical protein
MTTIRCMLGLVAITVTLIPAASQAAQLGEAAVVLHDNALIYEESDEPEIADHATKGEIVAYITGNIASPTFMKSASGGRVKVMYLRGDDPDWKMYHQGWMNPTDLSDFTYDCECSHTKGCTPLTDHPFRFRAFAWTVCLRQSGATHAKGALAAEAATAPTEKSDSKSKANTKCTVDQILKMKQAGLADAQIKAACGG